MFGRLVLRTISFQAMTAVRFIGALVFLVFLDFYYHQLSKINTATGKDWMYVFIIAILAGFVSLFIYYKGLQNTKASVATIAELAFPFSAVIVNWVFLDAKLEIGQIIGGIVLLISVLGLSRVNREDLVTSE